MVEHEMPEPDEGPRAADAPVSWKPIADGDRVLIALIGELDIATAPSFGAEVLTYVRERQGDVVLDCSELTFIDSSGIKALLLVHHAIDPYGRRIQLRNVSEVCRLPLDVSGLSRMFGLEE